MTGLARRLDRTAARAWNANAGREPADSAPLLNQLLDDVAGPLDELEAELHLLSGLAVGHEIDLLVLRVGALRFLAKPLNGRVSAYDGPPPLEVEGACDELLLRVPHVARV